MLEFRKTRRNDNLRKIQQLDPVQDHCQITHLMTGYEFPWDTTRSLEIVLIRTFCVPSISALLDKTGEFKHRPQKRYDDTGLLTTEIMKWGELDPRWNQMHAIHEYSSWTESPYEEDVYNDVLHNPYIVHFTTPPKPWQRSCKHPCQDLFFHYLDMTDWSGWRNTIWRRMWRRVRKETKNLWSFTKNAYKFTGTSSMSQS